MLHISQITALITHSFNELFVMFWFMFQLPTMHICRSVVDVECAYITYVFEFMFGLCIFSVGSNVFIRGR